MAQLMTASEIITISFTNKNTSEDLIGDYFIEIAQEEHVRPALAYGETDDAESLYATIVTQSAADTLTAVNTTLLNTYIKPMLAFYVKHELINDLMMQTTSQGIQINAPEGSVVASDTQRAAIKDQALRHANTLRDKMIMYIQDPDNIASYPLYNSANNVGSLTTKRGGIIMGTSDSSIDRN